MFDSSIVHQLLAASWAYQLFLILCATWSFVPLLIEQESGTRRCKAGNGLATESRDSEFTSLVKLYLLLPATMFDFLYRRFVCCDSPLNQTPSYEYSRHAATLFIISQSLSLRLVTVAEAAKWWEVAAAWRSTGLSLQDKEGNQASHSQHLVHLLLLYTLLCLWNDYIIHYYFRKHH